MSIFIENEYDEGWQEGDTYRYNGRLWVIVAIRCNERGIWLDLEGA